MAQAQTAADAEAELNRPGKTGGTIAVTCAGSGLTVTYSASGSTRNNFGVVAGSSQITTSTVSAATIGDAGGGGLRPWGICSGAFSSSTLGQVVFVPLYNNGKKKGSSTTVEDPDLDACGGAHPPGGWWVAQCVGQGNGTGSTQVAVQDGCDSSVAYHAVPNQPAGATPSQLYHFLTAACPSKAANATCLSSDTGNNFGLAAPQWQGLVGQTFSMPVFCVVPTCSDMAVAGNGNNASYAIQQIAKVELCGFELNKGGPSTGWPATGPCATANPKGYKSSDVATGSGFFVVIKGLSGSADGDYTMPGTGRLELSR